MAHYLSYKYRICPSTEQKAQIAQLEKEKKKASEDEKFSYTTEIQTAQMDLKKAEYEKKAKEVQITQMREKIGNSTVTSEIRI